MMNSFAFWCRPKGATGKPVETASTVEPLVNINLWIDDGRKRGDVSFDFGLMLTKRAKEITAEQKSPTEIADKEAPTDSDLLKEPSEEPSVLDQIEGVSLFCPFEVDEEQFKDLKPCLNKETLGAIFNDRCRVVERDFTARYIEVVLANSADDAPFYLLSCGSPKFEKCSDGTTIINIDFPHIAMEPGCNPTKVYVRFRLTIRGDQGLIKRNDSRDKLFTSAFSREETIDFRINDYRTLSDEIREKIDGTNPAICKLGKMTVHVLLMARTNVSVESFERLHEKRLLEGKGVWKSYLPDSSYSEDDIVAWHWKESPELGDGYKIYLKLVHSVCDWSTICLYLLFLVFFSVMTNAFTTVLCDIVKQFGFPNEGVTGVIFVLSLIICLLFIVFFAHLNNQNRHKRGLESQRDGKLDRRGEEE